MNSGNGRGPTLTEDFLAVLVLYGQTLHGSATFRSLGAELRRSSSRLELLVYDNSPTALGRPGTADAREWAREWDIHYVHDPSNPGVSRAYVEGAKLAVQRSKRWLLFLDQDTTFPPEALTRYVAAIRAHPEIRLFAPILRSAGRIVSPCVYAFKVGSPLRRLRPGPRRLTALSVLNSGMCVAVDDYLAVGGHDVRIGLDFSDHEFVHRFKRSHARAVVLDVECHHGLSTTSSPERPSQLSRFGSYCRGAKYASTGPLDTMITAGIVGTRAALLSLRHGDLSFVRIAAAVLLGGRAR